MVPRMLETVCPSRLVPVWQSVTFPNPAEVIVAALKSTFTSSARTWPPKTPELLVPGSVRLAFSAADAPPVGR
jgi:hypothetical protein